MTYGNLGYYPWKPFSLLRWNMEVFERRLESDTQHGFDSTLSPAGTQSKGPQTLGHLELTKSIS